MKTINDNLKLVVTILIVGLFLWFLVLYPIINFHNNESLLENAARRYFELNPNDLPTGERVKTVTLETLYHKSFLEKDLYAPYTRKNCSISKSWVKVRRENNQYQYYVYLDCGGALHSLTDHKGPEIRLNGDLDVSVSLGEDFTDPGVKSVIDGVDGRLKNAEVVTKGKVDTSKVGTYEITYTATDQLSNKTTVTRTVQVVQKLYQTILQKLDNSRNFVGNPDDNYLILSNMMFRIYGVDDANVLIVADEDVANVNYSKLDSWLEYYYNHLNSKTKKMIVASQFCNMKVTDTSLDTTQCNSYTRKRSVYIPSIVEVNKAGTMEDNFMKTSTMSWVANSKSDKQAYVTRDLFFGDSYGKSYLPYNITDNYGVRPMMFIKGDSLITGGDGTRENPFVFGDTKKGSTGKLVHDRFTGEYITDGGLLWRIIEPIDDGTTKIISVSSIINTSADVTFYPDPDSDIIQYNPKDKMSVGYFIENGIRSYVDTSKFVRHVVEVPIYKNKIIYGEEVDTKKYEVMLSAPNMYELFSAQTKNIIGEYSKSYWLINSSNGKRIAGAITDIGVPINEPIESYDSLGVRVVGYLKKDITISSGKGTEVSPYRIK